MISIQRQQDTARREISISNVVLTLSVLTIPLLIFTIHFLSVFFNLSVKYEYYEVGTTYFFNLNTYDNYTVIMGLVHSLLLVNFLAVILIIGLKVTKKHFFTPRKLKIKINGLQLAIVFLLMGLALIFLLYHNISQLNRLAKAIQLIERSEEVANITYLGFRLPTDIALIDFFLIPGIIIIIIIVILVFIRK